MRLSPSDSRDNSISYRQAKVLLFAIPLELWWIIGISFNAHGDKGHAGTRESFRAASASTRCCLPWPSTGITSHSQYAAGSDYSKDNVRQLLRFSLH